MGLTERPLIKSTSSTLMSPSNNNNEDNDKTILETLREKPATLIIAPFVILFGVDLILNIVFLTKRSIEYFAFGKAPSTEVWFSNNLFL